jgi:HEAT repeat protein
VRFEVESHEQKEFIEKLILSQTRGDREEPISRIVTLFRTPDPKVRSRAARLVGRYNSCRSFIDQRLLDNDQRVRANVIESLWRIDTAHASAVLKVAADDPDHRVRTNALVGLYHSGNPSARQLLIEQSQNPSVSFRAAAAWAMGEILDPAFEPILAELSKDPDLRVRKRVARALLKFRESAQAAAAKAAEPQEKAGDQ